jgi:hypothetical protein
VQLEPAATQVEPPPPPPLPVRWQHPPAPQTLPSQQGWPLPPQAAHFCVPGLHASPEAVQKSAASAPPGQQFSPAPPQGPPPPLQLDVVALQVPS